VIIGIDEVGYGCWAGPVFVCGVAAEDDWAPPGLRDSKKLSKKRIVEVSESLRRVVPYLVVDGDVEHIDKYGIGAVLRTLQKLVAESLLEEFPGARVVVDGNIAIPGIPDCEAIPKADDTVPAVSAASIIAKDARDAKMRELAKEYPGYGFEKHVGYGTQQHAQALDRLGVCPIHRKSYKPIAKRIKSTS